MNNIGLELDSEVFNMAGCFKSIRRGPSFNGVGVPFVVANNFNPSLNSNIAEWGENFRRWFGNKTICAGKKCDPIGYELAHPLTLKEIKGILIQPDLIFLPAIKFWMDESDNANKKGNPSFLFRDGRSNMFFVPLKENHSDKSVIVGVYWKIDNLRPRGGWHVRGYDIEYTEETRKWFDGNMVVVPDYTKYNKQK